jgi:hypothetical protein
MFKVHRRSDALNNAERSFMGGSFDAVATANELPSDHPFFRGLFEEVRRYVPRNMWTCRWDT